MILRLTNEKSVDDALRYPLECDNLQILFYYLVVPFPLTATFCRKVLQVLHPAALSHVTCLELCTRRLPINHRDANKEEEFQSQLFKHVSQAVTKVESLSVMNGECLQRTALNLFTFNSNLSRNLVNFSLNYLPCDRSFLTTLLGYLQMRTNPLAVVRLNGIQRLPKAFAEQKLLWIFFLTLSTRHSGVASFILYDDLLDLVYASMLLLRMNRNGFPMTLRGAYAASKAEVLTLLANHMKSNKKTYLEISYLVKSHMRILPAADFDRLEALLQLDTNISYQ